MCVTYMYIYTAIASCTSENVVKINATRKVMKEEREGRAERRGECGVC